MKKIIAFLSLILFSIVISSCGSNNSSNTNNNTTTTEEDRGPKTTITVVALENRMGYFDPEYKDPITGDYPIVGMDSYERDAKRRAIEIVENEYNVEFEFIPYPTNTPKVDILSSVLANDPVGDIVHLDGSSNAKLVVPQNVLQDLSDLDVIQDPENEWMTKKLSISDLILGFSDRPMGIDMTFTPMLYNISLIETCDAAMEIGYPSDLWLEGKWTWETMEEYFSALKVCGLQYDTPIVPYEVSEEIFVQQAAGSNGEYIVDTDNRISMLEWEEDPNAFNGYATTLNEAWDDALQLTYNYRYEKGYIEPTIDQPTSDGDEQYSRFGRGESYFAGILPYFFANATTEFTKRGYSLGIVPFPVGPKVLDGTSTHEYNFLQEGGDAFGVPKGVSQEKKELAVEAYIALIKENYVQIGYSDDDGNFDFELMKETEINKVVMRYFDVDHPVVGDDMYEMYEAYYDASQYYNPLKSLVGVYGVFYYLAHDGVAQQRHPNREEEIRKKVWTGDGVNVPVQQALDEALAKILSGEDPTDTTLPVITKVEEFKDKNITVSSTDPLNTQDFWKQFFNISDNISKSEDIVVEFDLSELDMELLDDFDLVVKATDQAGNTREVTYTIIIEKSETTSE